MYGCWKFKKILLELEKNEVEVENRASIYEKVVMTFPESFSEVQNSIELEYTVIIHLLDI